MLLVIAGRYLVNGFLIRENREKCSGWFLVVRC